MTQIEIDKNGQLFQNMDIFHMKLICVSFEIFFDMKLILEDVDEGHTLI